MCDHTVFHLNLNLQLNFKLNELILGKVIYLPLLTTSFFLVIKQIKFKKIL